MVSENLSVKSAKEVGVPRRERISPKRFPKPKRVEPKEKPSEAPTEKPSRRREKVPA